MRKKGDLNMATRKRLAEEKKNASSKKKLFDFHKKLSSSGSEKAADPGDKECLQNKNLGGSTIATAAVIISGSATPLHEVLGSTNSKQTDVGGISANIEPTNQAYSNRAASYTKLGTFPEGLKDANKCIELDPKFSKGYSRKGAIQFVMKEYDKALETYQTGLKYDEGNQELLDGIHRCIEQINKANRGDISAEDLKERQAKSLQDPEIQAIVSDPVMRQATPMDRFKAVKIYFSEMLKAYPRQQIHEDIWTMALTAVKDRVDLSDPTVVRDLYCYMIKTDIDNCDPRRVFIFSRIDELNMIIEDL